jgi:peroxiredoxin
MRIPGRSLFAGAILCIVLTGCSKAPSTARAADVKAEHDRKSAPDFALKDSSGATVHLADYKGKVVLLDFWATWCGPCKIEIPWFMEFEQQYKDRGFAVLGVSMDEGGWEEVKPYIEQRKINYRIVMGNDAVAQAYNKAASQIGRDGGVDSLPTTFLLDRSGRIATVHVGLEKGKNEIRDEIDHLLQGDQSARSSLFINPAFLSGAK